MKRQTPNKERYNRPVTNKQGVFLYSLKLPEPKQEGNFAKSVSCGGLATKSIMQYAVSECIAAMHFIGNYAEFNSLGTGLTAADAEPTAE